MFMGRGHSPDGDVIALYKHRETREYLNIDSGGRMYRYVNGAYVRLDPATAIESSLPRFIAALSAPESSCDATQR